MAKRMKRTSRASKPARRPRTAKTPTVPPWRIVDRKQLSLVLGVHEDTVTEYTRAGMPVIEAGRFGRQSRYDLAACWRWWRDHRRANPIEVALTKVLNGRAGLAEHKLRRDREGLVAAADVEADGRAYVAAWQAVVRSLARHARHAGIVTSDQSEAALDKLCREVLRDIGSWKTRAATRPRRKE